MKPFYIGCDGVPLQSADGTTVCPSAGPSLVLTEFEVSELYAIPKMDQEDYGLLAQHATFLIIFAFGVKLILKILLGNSK